MVLPHAGRRIRGFTLIELMVVIGVIGVLMSLLIPMVSKARGIAKSMVCQSNLRQIGSAAFFYADEQNGYLPPPRSGYASDSSWWDSLGIILYPTSWPRSRAYEPYHSISYSGIRDSVMVCPNHGLAPEVAYNSKGYGYNLDLTGVGSYFDPAKLNKLAFPSDTMMFLDSDGLLNDGATLESTLATSNIWATRFRHDFRYNILYVDGHLEHLNFGTGPNEFPRLRTDPGGNRFWLGQ